MEETLHAVHLHATQQTVLDRVFAVDLDLEDVPLGSGGVDVGIFAEHLNRGGMAVVDVDFVLFHEAFFALGLVGFRLSGSFGSRARLRAGRVLQRGIDFALDVPRRSRRLLLVIRQGSRIVGRLSPVHLSS